MAKKKGGLFGGLFDFNGDGKVDLGERYIAHKILEDCIREDNGDFSPSYDSDFDISSSNDYSWRDYCEDGDDYDVDPEDYETEEEYEEALNEAKYAWRDTCEYDPDVFVDPEDYETEEEYEEALEEARNEWNDDYENEGDIVLIVDGDDSEEVESAEDETAVEGNPSEEEELKESDFPNRRRYNAACTLANEVMYSSDNEYVREEVERCKFIMEKADTVIAANYLSSDGEFLYAQAIKEHFKLPVKLPDEDEERKIEFYRIISKLSRKDSPLSLEVWAWALEQFLPYAKYDKYAESELTSEAIGQLDGFCKKYDVELAQYMDKNPDFRQKIADGPDEEVWGYTSLIATAIRENLYETATVLFKARLKFAQKKWEMIHNLTERMIDECEDYEEVETIQFFCDELFPLIKAIPIEQIQDEIERWEQGISEYIKDVQDYAEDDSDEVD